MDNQSGHTTSHINTQEGGGPGLEKVRSLLRSLNKFVHGKKIYARNNPTLTKFSEEVQAAFKAFFEEEDELVLTVEQFSFTWRGHTVYENQRREESLAFLLYKDGIGELSIQNSVTLEELDQFVDVVKDEVHNYSQEEDIVTKLWKSDFHHISYRVLDDYLSGQFGDGSWGRAPASDDAREADDHLDLPSFKDKGRVIVNASTPLEPIDEYLQELASQAFPSASPGDREKGFQNMLETLFKVSSEELKLCQEEITEEKSKDGLVWLIEELLDFTLLQENPSAVRDVSNFIGCFVDFIAAEGDRNAVSQTLGIFRMFMERRSLPESVQQFCKKEETKLTSKPFLLAMGRKLKQAPKDADEVFGYFRVVGENAIEPLRDLLNELSGAHLHKEACGALIDLAGDNLPAVVEKLNTDKPEIARDVVHLMRASGAQTVPQVVQELMHYPDIQVREEVIGFLSDLDPKDAAMMLVRMMDDENKHIRIKAVAAVESMNNALVVKKIRTIALGKEFGKKDLDEQEAIFKALGKLCGPEIITELQQLVEKKNLLVFGQNKDNKLLVIRALEQIDAPEAVGLLDKLAEDSNNAVSTRAKRALEEKKNASTSHESRKGSSR